MSRRTVQALGAEVAKGRIAAKQVKSKSRTAPEPIASNLEAQLAASLHVAKAANLGNYAGTAASRARAKAKARTGDTDGKGPRHTMFTLNMTVAETLNERRAGELAAAAFALGAVSVGANAGSQDICVVAANEEPLMRLFWYLSTRAGFQCTNVALYEDCP